MTPKPFSADGAPLKIIDHMDYPAGAAEGVAELEHLAARMLQQPVTILLTNDATWPFTAACGFDRLLYINVRRVGWAFFSPGEASEELAQRRFELLIHELAHVRVSDHLSSAYADELCRLGARLALVVEKERV